MPGPQSTNTVTPIVFSDVNGNAVTVSGIGNLTVVLSIPTGTLEADDQAGATVVGNGTDTVTLTGTAAEINAALDGLIFTPRAAGDFILDIETTEDGGTPSSNLVDITVQNTTLVVTSSLDTGDDFIIAGSFADDLADGDGLSLREALAWALDGDIITFDLDSAAPGNQGGTIVLSGSQLVVQTSVTIDGDLDGNGIPDVTISANNASRVMLVNSNVQDVELAGLVLTDGIAPGGGAGLFLNVGSSTMVRDAVVSNNTASSEGGSGGGGIFGAAVHLTLLNTTVSENASAAFGGGVRVAGVGGELNVINSTVTGNSTSGAGAYGGGVHFGGTTLTVVNSTISGNEVGGAGAVGGGIRIAAGTSHIYNSTIVGNAATINSGGISANGDDTFVNTVVAGNTSGAGATAAVGGSPLATGGTADDVGGTVENSIHNYFGSMATITNDTGTLNGQGTANLLLSDLIANGGTILTHRPLAGSALVDAGSVAALPPDTFDLNQNADTGEALPVDAIGGPRVLGAGVDIGAREGGFPTVTTVAVPPAGNYVTGQALDFVVSFNRSVVVDDTNGVPRLAIVLDTGGIVYAELVAGSGSQALTFRLTVADGWLDTDGIELSTAIDLNGATIRDLADEDVLLTLWNVPNTSGIVVNIPPTLPPDPEPQDPVIVEGTDGDDVFAAMTGNVIYQGRDGYDTVIYAGSRNDYVVEVKADGSIEISFGDSTHELFSIERVAFEDGVLLFDIDNLEAPAIYRLYGAAFDRAPDESGFLYWLDFVESSGTPIEVARHFAASLEFRMLYGEDLSDANFITQLYLNTLERQGETDGVTFWNAYLAGGRERADVIFNFAQSAEYIGLSNPDIENGYWIV